jgi:hypothetical protein
VHDTKDAEVPITNGYVYAKAPNARMLVTDGLGHNRILRDLHVIDASVRFIAEQRASSPVHAVIPTHAAAPMAMAPMRKAEVREHRDMLTDVGAMA